MGFILSSGEGAGVVGPKSKIKCRPEELMRGSYHIIRTKSSIYEISLFRIALRTAVKRIGEFPILHFPIVMDTVVEK